jgi:hypothetical protein
MPNILKLVQNYLAIFHRKALKFHGKCQRNSEVFYPRIFLKIPVIIFILKALDVLENVKRN